jgi:hypothetical protein
VPLVIFHVTLRSVRLGAGKGTEGGALRDDVSTNPPVGSDARGNTGAAPSEAEDGLVVAAEVVIEEAGEKRRGRILAVITEVRRGRVFERLSLNHRRFDGEMWRRTLRRYFCLLPPEAAVGRATR